MAKSYKKLLKDPRWQKKRLKVLERAGWACERCGDTRTELHVHHTFYDGSNPWEYPESSLSCLCKPCHDREHEEENQKFKYEKKESVEKCIAKDKSIKKKIRVNIWKRTHSLTQPYHPPKPPPLTKVYKSPLPPPLTKVYKPPLPPPSLPKKT